MDKELVDYFIAETNKRFERLEEKVDILLQFKWQVATGIFIISAGVTFAANLLVSYIGR